MTNQHQHQKHRDGGRAAAVAANSSHRKIYEEPNYDPDWAICPDGGSNNRWDYQRHFPTCQGYKCLYSCDAAWDYYQGLDAPLDFSYELTVKTGVSGSVLTTALLEMEERMLNNMAQALGIDDCICSTMNGDGRGYRALRAPNSKDASNAVAEKKVKKQPRKMQGSVPEGQEVVNLSNLIKDDILAGKCKKSSANDGEACIRMAGHMRFVHTVEVDNHENPRLSYEGALSQLNELLYNGMQEGTFLEHDVPEEEQIITGMTFIPETSDDFKDDDAEGEGDSGSFGTAGTAPINPGQGLENIPESEDTPPVDVIPIGSSPNQPISSTKGRSSSVSYGFYGLFAIVIAVLVIVGIVVRRRRNKDEDENENDDEEEAGIGSISSTSSADEEMKDGDSPAYDLTEVKEVDSDEIGASASEESQAREEETLQKLAAVVSPNV